MYLLDFYNQAAVHNDTRGPKHGPTNAAVRPDRDRLHGRIWRINHQGEGSWFPDLTRTTDPRVLLDAIGLGNSWMRTTAQRMLREWGTVDHKS